jgi:hypothetical protein
MDSTLLCYKHFDNTFDSSRVADRQACLEITSINTKLQREDIVKKKISCICIPHLLLSSRNCLNNCFVTPYDFLDTFGIPIIVKAVRGGDNGKRFCKQEDKIAGYLRNHVNFSVETVFAPHRIPNISVCLKYAIRMAIQVNTIGYDQTTWLLTRYPQLVTSICFSEKSLDFIYLHRILIAHRNIIMVLQEPSAYDIVKRTLCTT